MRLLPEQIEHVVTASRELLGADARVWLFGSRVHDDVRGGDIDLLVEAKQPVEQPVTLAAQLTARLQRRLGDRRIDVLVTAADAAPEPIHCIARAEGVLLTP
jgi:hypothetical protein